MNRLAPNPIATCSTSSCRRRVSSSEGTLVAGAFVCGVCLLAVDPDESFNTLVTRETAGGKKLKPYQQEDVIWLAKRRRALVANQMGTGKTPTGAIGALRRDSLNIVICPSSLTHNWAREIGEWRPDLTLKRATTGESWARSVNEAQPGTVVVSSYGLLPGAPCGGCRSRDIATCTHFGPDSPHPEWIDPVAKIPYRLPKTRNFAEVMREIRAGKRPAAPKVRWQQNPLPDLRFRTVLLGDEIHAVKHPNTERTRRWRQLAWLVSSRGGHVYGLSGTPVENNPQEYWEVLVSLGLERAAFGDFDKFEKYFHLWYGAAEKENRRPPEPDDMREVLMRLGRVRVFRRTQDVLKDLPPIVDMRIDVEITAEQMDRINASVQRMVATQRAWADVEAGRLPNPHQPRLEPDEAERRRLVYRAKIDEYFLQKPWTEDAEITRAVEAAIQSTEFTDGGTEIELMKIRRLLSMAKIGAVEEWVENAEAQGEPVVLFCQHIDMVKRFGERPGWVAFHGQMSDDKRDQAVQDFQSGKARHGIAVSIGAGREGITLTRSRHAAFIDLNWNPAKNRQAVARVRRIGAEKHHSIQVTKFIADHPVDRIVLETLEVKERLLDAFDAIELTQQQTLFSQEGEAAA